MGDDVSKRPNLLYLMTDQQRADTIGMVQCGIEVTPNLNRLAARSAHFTRAYTSCPICMPARTALATGVYPTTSGVLTNDQVSAPPNDRVPLQQILCEAGYDVAQVGIEDIWLRPRMSERGQMHFVRTTDYDLYLSERGMSAPTPDRLRTPLTEQTERGPDTRPYANCLTEPWPFEARHFADAYFAREAVSFLRTDRSRPFAAFLGVTSPHPPLRAPEPYCSLFDPDEIDLPDNVGALSESVPANRRRGIPAQMGADVSISDWRKAWSAYLGLTHLADAELGRVLDVIGDDSNTVVAFTSDHGDMLGQHRMYQKMEMYESALRVPLVVHHPSGPVREIDSVVSHLDVMPTLLDLLDVPVPEGLDGRSLADAIRSGASLEPQPAFAQFSGCFGIADIRRAVVRDRFKYVWSPDDQVELFDLEADPMEMNNLAGSPDLRELQGELHALCREWAGTHHDWVRL